MRSGAAGRLDSRRNAGLSILPTAFLGRWSRIEISTGHLYFERFPAM